MNKNKSPKNSFQIILINQLFPPDFAATGQLLEDLTRRIASSSLKIDILTSIPSLNKNKQSLNIDSINRNRKVRRISVTNFLSKTIKGKAFNGLIFSFRAISSLIFKHLKADLIILTTEPPFFPILWLPIYFCMRKKYILIAYDLYPDILTKVTSLSNNSLIVKLWYFFNRKIYKYACKIIVLSEPMKDKIIKRYSNKIDGSKIHIIPSWADPDEIMPMDRENNNFIFEHNLINKFVVLYSGNFGRAHDFDTLLKAASTLKRESEITFLFIGGGVQEYTMRKYVLENKLTNCTFLPFQNLSNLPYSLASADIAIVSHTDATDGLVAPSKLYGHLAAGSPIAAITPASSYLANLVESSNCGKWFNNGDCSELKNWILEVKENRNKKSIYQKNARNLLLRTATPNIIVEEYLTVIKSAINS